MYGINYLFKFFVVVVVCFLLVKIIELQKEKNRNNDNKNNENVTKCWEVEIFQIIEPCSKCDSFAKSSLKACKSTGYREILNCEKYGLVSRR